MLGLSRNTWFGIGGVLLAVVLYVGFSRGDDAKKADDAVAAQKKKKGGKKRKKKPAAIAEGGIGVGKVCARLDCSAEQLSSLKSTVKEHRKRTSTNRRALAEAHAKIAAELAEAELDTIALDDAYAAAQNERSAIDDDARSVLESFHGTLTASQREGLAKLVARHGPTMLLARPAAGSDNKKRSGGRRKGRRKRGLGGAAGEHRGMPMDPPTRPAEREPLDDAPNEAPDAAPDEAPVAPAEPSPDDPDPAAATE